MTPDEALRRVRDPHEVLTLTDVELTEAAVTLAVEVEGLRAENQRLDAIARMYQPARNEADRLAIEVERLHAIETRLREAVNGDIYTEFGTADLQHFLGEG